MLEAVHRDLFLPNFPDPDEQEGPDDWVPRLWEDPARPKPEQHAFVAGTHLENGRERSLAGFAFVERYRESRCALLSYVAVDGSRRGQGLARCLFDRALDSVQQSAQQHDEPVRAVFAEIHDPQRVNRAHDVVNPAERVRIMARLGAWRVPISYVQPALGERSRRSDRLMLIAFPLDAAPRVEAGAVAEFLDEYYRSLGIEDPSSDPALRKIANQLAKLGSDFVDLVPLAPSLEFKRFSVVLHFVGGVAEENPTKTSQWRKAPMKEEQETAGATDEPPENPFESFEEDLLSYRYLPQGTSAETRDLPFESHIVGDHPGTVEWSVPLPIAYHSEGKERRFYLPPLDSDGARKLAVKASRTDFKSGYSVFHLALVPSHGALDEYDLVALSKLWQTGEAWAAAEEICLDGAPVEAVVREVFENDNELTPVSLVRGGTIQLITDDPPRGVTWATIWDAVNVLRGEDGDKERVAEEIATATPVGKQVKALGGIVQGILDFQAVDATELSDVFAALEMQGGGLLGIHKGTLLCVMESDRSYDAAAEEIGVSPYVLLPQAVLLHNEVLLDRVAGLAKNVENKKDRGDLAECFKAMRRLLGYYVPNVFHYPQERRLFERGENARGLSERRMELLEQADEIERRWKVAVEKRRSSADTIRNVLLALIGLSTFPYVHGVGVAVGLFGLILSLVILSLHSNPQWSWTSPRSWRCVVVDWLPNRRDGPGTSA